MNNRIGLVISVAAAAVLVGGAATALGSPVINGCAG
jgi:hypothetical protein